MERLYIAVVEFRFTAPSGPEYEEIEVTASNEQDAAALVFEEHKKMYGGCRGRIISIKSI